MDRNLKKGAEEAVSAIDALIYYIEELESERDELRQLLDTANERIEELENEVEELRNN
jgi:peptidoglycan hydrolase CwlO-like protein